jgi:hypothetical protein
MAAKTLEFIVRLRVTRINARTALSMWVQRILDRHRYVLRRHVRFGSEAVFQLLDVSAET